MRSKVSKNKPSDKKVVIGELPEDFQVICNYCNLPTNVRLTKDSFYCNKCNVEIIITKDDVRRYYELQVPEGPAEETLVSSTNAPTIRKKEVELQGGFKALRDKGLKIKKLL